MYRNQSSDQQTLKHKFLFICFWGTLEERQNNCKKIGSSLCTCKCWNFYLRPLLKWFKFFRMWPSCMFNLLVLSIKFSPSHNLPCLSSWVCFIIPCCFPYCPFPLPQLLLFSLLNKCFLPSRRLRLLRLHCSELTWPNIGLAIIKLTSSSLSHN
jgi:hypothetical protein